jgi:hypothetical protein
MTIAVYKSVAYEAPIDDGDISLRIARVKMFEQGHSFEEIDSMNFHDFTDVLSYWAGDSMGMKKKHKKA